MQKDELKAQALLEQMTVEEKLAQMVQVPYSHVGREEALRWASLGAGSFLHVLGDDAREIQQTAMSSRLGIPVLFGIDAIHGHGLNKHATIFPSQLATACSWNPQIAEEMGRVTAREVATDGLHWTFSPVLCLGRDTRWGRVDETFGEDGYLAGELGAAIIKGYQGDSLADDESILACAKHYIGYGEATGARDSYDTQMTYRKMREVFLPPFRKAVEAGCATVMTAYGSIDGKPFTADRKSVHDILRDELGFDGFVVTDWDNCNSLYYTQHMAEDLSEAAVLTAKAGNDMIMTSTDFFAHAKKALQEGKLSIEVIDEAVLHILTMKFRMGLFEKPEKKGKPGCIGCKEHQQAALRAARASVTLLHNDGVLPIHDSVKKIVLVGANADDIEAQYGDWTYFTHPMPKQQQPVRPYVTLREGMEELAKENGIELVYVKGCSVIPQEDDDLQKAVDACKDADLIVMAVGDVISQYGEAHDRANLDLSGRQEALFDCMRETGLPVVTVLIGSKPLCLRQVATDANAFVCAFHGGMFGGQAIAEALFGKLNPSGRLPISFPQHVGQLPVYYNQLSGWHGGKYCDLPKEPLYVFGEGEGYTTFQYTDASFDEKTLCMSVTVTNTGTMRGTETVQLYLHDEAASVLRPFKQLVHFCQVTLEGGESRRVLLKLKREDFAIVAHDEQTVIEKGQFTLMVGHSSKEEDLLSVPFYYE